MDHIVAIIILHCSLAGNILLLMTVTTCFDHVWHFEFQTTLKRLLHGTST